MQLLDWILWNNQDMTNLTQKQINNIFTKIAITFNHLQPIILCLLIYFFYSKIGYWSKISISIYTILFILYDKLL